MADVSVTSVKSQTLSRGGEEELMIGDVEEGREVVASMTTKPTLAGETRSFRSFRFDGKTIREIRIFKKRKEKRRWQGV